MPKKTIMVVDDEKAILKSVSDVLQEEGYEVIKADSGNAALKTLKTAKPDLILLDFFMPEMSGREVCEKIRVDRNLKELKIAFLTVAQFSNPGREKLNNMKVLDCIQKPFNNKDLIKRVKNIIEK